MGQPATLKKISEQLNLSISTVSRALKDHPDISENTRRKVKELAALMEYEPNALAVNLRTSKSNVLGLIVPSISNTFYDSFIASAENEARKSGYTLMILQSGEDPVREAENLKLCKHYRVDGILISIVTGSYSTDLSERFKAPGIPLVYFDRVPVASHIDTVCIADAETGTLAANTLLKYRKKKVLALFGGEGLSITQKRKEAFVKTLEKESSQLHYDCRHCSNSEAAMDTVLEALRGNKGYDQLFCMSDELLVGAMKAVNQLELRVPDDISILAISNGFIPGLYHPAITHIQTSGQELGSLAIRRMLENLAEKQEPRAILLPSRLVEGGSL